MRVCVLWTMALLCGIATSARAQQTARDSALALAAEGRQREALPVMEKLLLVTPSDRVLHERAGLIVLALSGTPKDAAARKQERVRARTHFARAVALGSQNLQVKALLDAIPPDGGTDAVFSDNKAVDQAMNEAENAFSSGDFRAALAGYQKALSLDPTMYNAATFIGDVFVQLKELDSAYVWYARATSINPDRETAWRYWSDVLGKNNHPDEARDKAIEAIVAEPYSRISRQGLIGWSQAARTPIGLPRVILPVRDTALVHPRGWTAYDSVRRAWRGSDGTVSALFSSAYPGERIYRHSVAEEKAALSAAWRAGGDDPAVVNLKKIEEAGMLDALVFFARADDGIVTEYEAYRRTHRDLLKRFWAEFVVGAPLSR